MRYELYFYIPFRRNSVFKGLNDEQTLRRGIFRNKRDEVTTGWKKLDDVELHNLYPSTNSVFLDIICSVVGIATSYELDNRGVRV
jgi:hypothetical protein